MLNLEISFLLISSIYAFILPFKRNITIIDTLIFLTIYISYIYFSIKSPRKERELVGIPEYLATFPTTIRRLITILLFIYFGFIILISVEAFAEGLIATGKMLNLDPFLMVQWLAPFTSEFPELLIALLFVSRSRTSAGINTLISSKVNQWTLLIGTISIIFSISSGSIHPLPLDMRQTEEILLTAAQSIFTVSVILDLKFSLSDTLLFSLFMVQFLLPGTEIRLLISVIYIILTIPMLIRHKSNITTSYRHVLNLIKK